MNSDEDTERTSRNGGRKSSVSPATAALNRKLGTAPAPRMLTQSELDLLRQSAREIAQTTREVLANRRNASAS